MTQSFIAIRGNHLNKASEIFETFKYRDTHQDQQFDNWQKFNDFLFDNYFELSNNQTALRGLWSDNGWTIIHDPEMVDTEDEFALLELSRIFKTDILTFIIQTTSNSFGFTLYNGTIKRNFLVSGGEVTDNLYQPLEQEQGLSINEETFTDDILKLAYNFGIDLEGKTDRTYIVKRLAFSDEMKTELEQFKQQTQGTENKKPWWKVW
ncbi:hypothetical protein [Flavisolibacter nicotianae]|uniref:hypothetical protein n=1 Tax=Flavisolibacter nicotianae TaxID=2364882 RepID=UPI000EAE43D0|nr:hypothetical protein [Flavisolibacter nicotianae]